VAISDHRSGEPSWDAAIDQSVSPLRTTHLRGDDPAEGAGAAGSTSATDETGLR
jgi:hypothetical protein